MKNYRILTAILCSVLMYCTAFGQSTPECGTIPTPEEIEYLNQTEHLRQAFSYDIQDREPIQVPIVNHIIRQSNGAGGLTTQELATAIQGLNNFYAAVNIQFFECEPVKFINNSNWYNFNNSDDFAVYSTNNVQGALNIYYFNSISSSFGPLCGYANFPSANPRDRIMMANDCTTSGTTLIHELGHYFSVFHTHGTSNCGTTDELVNGSNCSFAGDRVCDTPADPNLFANCQTSLVSGCQYIGTATDANGQPYNPQVDNIMSYGPDGCGAIFTQGQFDRVVFSAMNDRNYLTCSNGGCTDNDNDGVCQADDCNDNNASIGARQTPGTACDDGNPNTNNDVIQANGCTCAGTPGGGGGNPCEVVQVSASGSNVTINNITSANLSLRIIGPGTGWSDQVICSSSCGSTRTVSGLTPGNYTVKALGSNPGCYDQFAVTVTGGGGGCTDNDNDGVCQADDCNDNNASVGARQTPGTACDDNNPNTQNDVIQANGCTCAGTPIGGCTDNDNDGVCQADDCNDNNASIGARQTPGTACDDGNPNTNNDVIQANGCTCAGTPGGGGGNPCQVVQVSASGSNVTITNITSSNMSLRIIGPGTGWSDQVICNSNCGSTRTVSGLTSGNYTVKALNSNPGCYDQFAVTVTGGGGGGCTDNDNDGVCQADDCNDNSASVGAKQTPGTACDDGNPNTQNDVIQADQCTCAGTAGPGPGGNPCQVIQVSGSGSNVTINNITSANLSLRIIGPGTGWNDQVICSSNCGSTRTVSGLTPGNYTVKALNSNPGCYDQFSVALGGGANVIQTNTDITIYPNPAKDKVFLNLGALSGNQGTISIFNSIGQTVKTFAFKEIPFAHIQWDTNEVTNGIYLISIQTNDRRITKKIIINKTY